MKIVTITEYSADPGAPALREQTVDVGDKPIRSAPFGATTRRVVVVANCPVALALIRPGKADSDAVPTKHLLGAWSERVYDVWFDQALSVVAAEVSTTNDAEYAALTSVVSLISVWADPAKTKARIAALADKIAELKTATDVHNAALAEADTHRINADASLAEAEHRHKLADERETQNQSDAQTNEQTKVELAAGLAKLDEDRAAFEIEKDTASKQFLAQSAKLEADYVARQETASTELATQRKQLDDWQIATTAAFAERENKIKASEVEVVHLKAEAEKVLDAANAALAEYNQKLDNLAALTARKGS